MRTATNCGRDSPAFARTATHCGRDSPAFARKVTYCGRDSPAFARKRLIADVIVRLLRVSDLCARSDLIAYD